MKIAIIDINTQKVELIYENSAPNQAMFGGHWGRPEQSAHVEVSDQLIQDITVDGYTNPALIDVSYENNEWVLSAI
jgi:hypothetical protein